MINDGGEFGSCGLSQPPGAGLSNARWRKLAPAACQMMGVFAEFERAMIAERVRAGLIPINTLSNPWLPSRGVRWT